MAGAAFMGSADFDGGVAGVAGVDGVAFCAWASAAVVATANMPAMMALNTLFIEKLRYLSGGKKLVQIT